MELVHLLCAVLVAIPMLYMSKATLTYLIDPLSLRKYPSPGVFAAATPFWLLKEQWMQQRSRNTHHQHQKLGDVIRIAPNLLMFNIPEAVTDIYGHQAARKLVKDEFYDRQAGDEHDTVNVRDHSDHAQRRKYLSNSFALKTVTDMEPVIRENFQRLLDHIDHNIISHESSRSGILDIRKWLGILILELSKAVSS
jgi:benzoate 4-monooxygenase